MGKGMGGDGGVYPPTSNQLKWMYQERDTAKPMQMVTDEIKWVRCAASQETLRDPMVICPLGRLFTKEEVLTRLVNKTLEPQFSYIQKMKDLKPFCPTKNPEFEEQGARVAYLEMDKVKAPFYCPVSFVEMNGRFKFSMLPCGCVISERALSHITTTDCPVCQKEYDSEDIIIVNPTEEQTEVLAAKLNARRAASKESKKNKKTEAGPSGPKEKEKVGEKRTASVANLPGPKHSLNMSKKAAKAAEDKVGAKSKKSDIYKKLFLDKNAKREINLFGTPKTAGQ